MIMAKEVTQQTFNFELAKEKFDNSTSTVEELRLAIFAPVSKFPHNSKTMINMKKNKKIVRKTNWGEVTVERTPLSQIHRDLLDCILSYGDSVKPLGDNKNTIAYCFSATDILKHYGAEKSRNTKWLEDRLKDMMSSIISIKPKKDEIARSFQIISFVGYKEELGAYYLELNSNYVHYFTTRLTINYKKSLPELLAVKSPMIRAIIRLALTQNQLTMKVYDPTAEEGKTGILEAIGYPIESDAMKKSAYKTLKDNIEVLKSFGVHYSPSVKNTMKFKKKEKITFVPPLVNKKLKKMGTEEENAYVLLQEFVDSVFLEDIVKFKITKIIFNVETESIEVSAFDTNGSKSDIKVLTLPNEPKKVYDYIKSKIIEEAN